MKNLIIFLAACCVLLGCPHYYKDPNTVPLRFERTLLESNGQMQSLLARAAREAGIEIDEANIRIRSQGERLISTVPVAPTEERLEDYEDGVTTGFAYLTFPINDSGLTDGFYSLRTKVIEPFSWPETPSRTELVNLNGEAVAELEGSIRFTAPEGCSPPPLPPGVVFTKVCKPPIVEDSPTSNGTRRCIKQECCYTALRRCVEGGDCHILAPRPVS